jgi:hypothetical protein
MAKPRVDSGGLRLHGGDSGERKQREIEGEGVNRGVSRVAGVEVELTGATYTAETRRWLQNRPETRVDDGGAPQVRARARGGCWGSAEGHDWRRGVSEWGCDFKWGSSAWGGGREKRDVGTSTVGRAGGRLGRRRGLTGGVRGQAREGT